MTTQCRVRWWVFLVGARRGRGASDTPIPNTVTSKSLQNNFCPVHLQLPPCPEHPKPIRLSPENRAELHPSLHETPVSPSTAFQRLRACLIPPHSGLLPLPLPRQQHPPTPRPGWPQPRCHLLTGFSLPAIADLKPSLGFTLRLSSQLRGTLPEGRAPALPSLLGPRVQMRPGQLEAPSSGSICRVMDGGLSRLAGSREASPQPHGSPASRSCVHRAVSPAAALWDPVGCCCPPRQLPLLGIPTWLPREAGVE